MFKIGFDLDNTIVNCFKSFKKVSFKNLQDKNICDLKSREKLRNYIRVNFHDKIWTEIQSEVYGPKYYLCPPFKNCIEVLKRLSLNKNYQIYIISHKTSKDSANKGYNLQNFAKSWILDNIFRNKIKINLDDIYLCESQAEKIKHIFDLKLDCFIDDLKEIYDKILNEVPLPILYSDSFIESKINLKVAKNWLEIERIINEFL